MNPPTPHDLGFQDKTRAGYPARITSVTEKKICGEYWYCGKWIKNNWFEHGMIAKDGLYKTDVDLVKILDGVRISTECKPITKQYVLDSVNKFLVHENIKPIEYGEK